MHNDSVQKPTNQIGSEEKLSRCRDHIERMQNIIYLLKFEANRPTQVLLTAKMLEWHVDNLSDVLAPASPPPTCSEQSLFPEEVTRH
jgi:hypothetical protein